MKNKHITGETKMNTRYFLKKTVVLVVVFQLVFGQAVFAATTDKDLTLDDGTGDSPSVILRDADDFTLIITKADTGEVRYREQIE